MKHAEEESHIPVLCEAVVSRAKQALTEVNNMLDGTFGRGGHTSALMAAFPRAKLTAMDRDEEAIGYGRLKFSKMIKEGRLKLVRDNFLNWKKYVEEPAITVKGGGFFDLILLDLGVSSPQLDLPQRGFSFYQDGPLDMRMDRHQELTAAEIVNTWSAKELSDLFYHLGEIKFPNKVVRSICEARALRPIETTQSLAELIVKADGWRQKGKHPATKYFLALRLKVNEELGVLKEAVPSLVAALRPGGLLMIISFHSTEDRIVKTAFKALKSSGTILTKKVVQAERPELDENPRARSAKLRVFQKGVENVETGVART